MARCMHGFAPIWIPKQGHDRRVLVSSEVRTAVQNNPEEWLSEHRGFEDRYSEIIVAFFLVDSPTIKYVKGSFETDHEAVDDLTLQQSFRFYVFRELLRK